MAALNSPERLIGYSHSFVFLVLPMNRKAFAPDKEISNQIGAEQQDKAANRSGSPIFQQDADDLKRILQDHSALVAQLASLSSKEKVALMHHWMAQLDSEQLQALIASGQQQLSVLESPPPVQSQTRLLLKKDYTYQQQGLSRPTQYYVYLRRRKPKLDRYIGTLFYVPEGCTLSYKVDAKGRVLFYPPHNLFQLKDTQNPTDVRLVRLLFLEPPPPDYTFTKQQNDSPQIHLHLEYLDPHTHQVLSQERYPFPFCMYEGGQLDRYRWEVSVVSSLTSGAETSFSGSALENSSSRLAADAPHRVLTDSKQLTQFFLANPEQAPLILERMRLWVSWSDRAMPQSHWKIVQPEQTDPINQTYRLIHSDSKRTILSCRLDQATVRFHHSLPVVMQWFQALGLAVSESQDQRQYTAAELKLAHSLFIDMSLSQTDPLVVLKQLFGVSFTNTATRTDPRID